MKALGLEGKSPNGLPPHVLWRPRGWAPALDASAGSLLWWSRLSQRLEG